MAEEDKNVLQLKVGKFSVRFSFEDLDLKCPGCRKDIVDAPIYCCYNEHNLCLQCYNTLYNNNAPCPQCQCSLTCSLTSGGTRKRNRFLESIVTKLPKISCRFEGAGCSHSMTDKENLAIHETEECDYRPMQCPICAVIVQGTSGMNGHVGDEHGQLKCCYGETVQIAVKAGKDMFESGASFLLVRQANPGPSKALAELKMFTVSRTLLRCPQRSTYAPVMLAWVSEGGLRNVGPFDSDYEFKVDLVGRDGITVVQSVRAPCSACDVDRGKACLTLTPRQMTEATTEAGYYRLNVSIFKKSPILNDQADDCSSSADDCSSSADDGSEDDNNDA